jgi:putative ABC transport system permease protein
MLNLLLKDQLALGLTQAVIAVALALVTVWLANRQAIHVERDTAVALVRGIAQMVAVGLLLAVLLRGPNWTAWLVLTAMGFFAATTAARRAGRIPGALRVCLYSTALGAGLIIVVSALLGLINLAISSLVPVGSMLLANAMNTNALALERFHADVTSHVGQIEAGLALGADPRVTVQPYVRSAVQASLIPRIDTLRSLGIVWIPGLMAGMTLSGSSPVYAAIYQFVVIALIFAASGLTSITATMLIRGRAFSPAEQLALRA